MTETARGWLARNAPPMLLFGFGLALCLHHGRQGFMPLDQSIVFDGGWRWLSGQLPFRDYVAPNGFVPHAMQAVFFAVLGVTWLAYCLHAAILNGLFALLVHRTLRAVGLPEPASLVYGALSAVVLYPPLGVPYMDPHAFFFSLLAVWIAIAGRRSERAAPRRWPWLLLPGAFALAALSKQIPSAFVLPIGLAIALVDPGARRRRLGLLLAGSAAVVVALGLGLVAVGADPSLIATYFWRLPAEEAGRRLAEVSGLAGFLARLWHEPARLGLLSIAVVHGVGLAALLALAWLPGLRRQRATAAGAEPLLAPLRTAALAEALLLVCLAFVALTLNQPAQGLAYVFLAAGLAHATLERARAGLTARPRAALALRAAGIAILLLAVRDGLRFEMRVNVPRSVNDIAFDPREADRAREELPPALSFLRWQTSRFVQFEAADLGDLVEFLSAQPEGFLLIGDASIAYGLTGKPSASPSLWLHPGLTLPLPEDAAFPEYQQRLLEQMQALDVRFLVLEGRHTWNHLSLADFPRLAPLARQRPGAITRFGGFTVIDLRDRPRPADAALTATGR